MADVLQAEWDGSLLLVRQEGPSPFRFECDPAWNATQLAEHAEQWKQQLADAGLGGHDVHIGLARELVTLRVMTIPTADPVELTAMVRYQAASTNAIELDRLELDYLVLDRSESETNVLVVVVPPANGTRLRNLLRALDWTPKVITPAAVATLAWDAERSSDATSVGGTLLCWLHEGELELVAAREHRLLASHHAIVGTSTTELPATVKREYGRFLIAFNKQFPGERLANVHVVADGESSGPLVAFLHDRLPDSTIKPVEGASAHLTLEGLRRWDALPEEARLNIASPRKAEIARNWTPYIYGGVAALAALVLLVVILNRSGRIDSLTEQVAEADSSRKDLESLVDRSQPQFESAGRVQEWLQQETEWLRVMQTLDSSLGSESLAYVNELQMSKSGTRPATVVAKGYAADRGLVESTDLILQSIPGLVLTPREIAPTGGDADTPIAFQFDLTINPTTTDESPGGK